MPAQKLRLVRVLVQPVFMLDDGESLTDVEHAPIPVPAADWPTYSIHRFPTEVAAWAEAQGWETDLKPAPPGEVVLGSEALQAPNRAQRRAK